MSFKAIVYAYVLGGLTFIPLVVLAACFYAIYTSVPVGDPDIDKHARAKLEQRSQALEGEKEGEGAAPATPSAPSELNDLPKTRRGWMTVRRTFEETASDGSYVGLVKGFLDARSKDPKRSRPKDMWYMVLKGKVLYLYEDENMTECEAAIELGSHDIVVYPEGLQDGELFAKRNAICLKPKVPNVDDSMPSITKEMQTTPDFTDEVLQKGGGEKQKQRDKARAQELEKRHEEARQEALDPSTPWFIFVRSNVDMEDWYFALVHASDNPPNSSTLAPLQPVFRPSDVLHLIETLDEQPDVIPMRWLNALIGRIFFSFYRTQQLESYIIGRLMRKLSKIKRPGFLTDLSVREVSVGNKAPTLSKPMLKELTKEGDASLEIHLHYKGEVRITVDATATINLGARFKSYTVKLVLAAVLREIEGNLLIKVKRPPSNRIWYAFTQMPRMVLDVEPVVSDRQITWSMILSTIESRLKEVIQESVVLPNMDDIAFFESSKYMHRGGIWADASRNERELFPTSPDSDEEKPPSSAPASDPTTPLASDVDHVGLQRSSSAPIETQVTVDATPETIPPALSSRAKTISTSSVSSTGSAARKRTWFGGSRDEGITSPEQPSHPELTEPERGRTGAPDVADNRRSSSTPHDTQTEGSARSDTSDNHSGSEESDSRVPARRSLSRHSSYSAPSQDAAQSSSSGAPSTSPAESLLAGLRSKSPAASVKTNPGSPTSNFFQTLKTRDKQAISNSAKEAMRKWGVNWGGLKKDAQTTSGDEVPDGEMQRQPADKANKARPGYAEVRAAVEQRRVPYNNEGLQVPASEPSEPMDIPGRSNAPSISSTGPGSASGQSAGNTSSTSASPRSDRLMPDFGSRPRSTSPSVTAPLTRPRAVSNHSQSDNEAALNAPLDEDEQPARPIHTQPPTPKTMTIPGIHASHRGEVMSMGYVAPPTPSEQKKGAAIQSVYRLWKGPQQSQAQGVQPDSQASSETVVNGEHDADNAPPAWTAQPLTPTLTSTPARPVPPPLPPRSNSTNAVSLLSEPPPHPPELGDGSPPASAALQSIASKDRSRRASLDPPLPPPLPARRLPAAADAESVANGSPAPSAPASPAIGVDGSPKPRPPLPPRRTVAPA